MNWQLLIAIALVAVAALYLLRQTWRTWSVKRGGCGGGCGCGAKPKASEERALISAEQLVQRLKLRD